MPCKGAFVCGGDRTHWRAANYKTRVFLLTSVVAAGCCFAATSQATTEAGARAACGSELWSLKTLSHPQRKLVDLRPRTTTVPAINRRRAPTNFSRHRDAFERQVWRVRAQIVEFKLEADSDIHLVLFGQGSYLIAEMPAAACLPRKTRARRAVVAARRVFENRCGAATAFWPSLGAVASISGVGFWDFPHGQSGHARNYAELHPVTGIHLIAGCGS